MKLTELCQVIQDVSNITVTLLTSEKDFRNFCKTWQFHDKQDYLKTDTLKWLFMHLIMINSYVIPTVSRFASVFSG